MVDKRRDKSNPVAKHARTYNKAKVFLDRKKAHKRGDLKHKGNLLKDDSLTTNSSAKKPINYTKPDGSRGVRMVPHNRDVQNEDLRKWFGKGKEGDWVRVGTDGEIKGDCARDEGEGKPKCMPRSKAHSMSTKDRASSARRKRRADPTVDRPGTGNKPIMVNTDKKESVQEKNVPTNPKLWAKFKSQAKSKFDVYPSAYANGWAAKQYKAAGGGWKSMKEEKALRGEEVEQVDENYSKKSTASLQKTHDKWKDRPMTPAMGNELHKIRRELQKRSAMRREEVEQVDEISKGLKSRYMTKAQMDAFKKVDKAYRHEPESPESKKHMASAMKRGKGMALARKKMKEGVEQVDEVNAPSTVKHKGKTYYSTGKQGKDIKTGAPSFEYSSDMDGNDERVFYNTKTKKITRESVEQVEEASQVLIKKMQQLAGGPDKMPRGAEFRALKQRAQDELKKDKAAKKAAPAQKTTSKTSKGKTQTGSADPADRNLIMQLRKAQDVDGKMDIQVSPAGKTIRLPKKQIDSLLKKHDSLGKPVDKRKFKIMLTKALRAKAK